MRARLVGAVAVALAIAVLPAPSGAVTRVDGSRFGGSGVRILSQGCIDPALAPSPRLMPKLRLVRDDQAPLGRGAIGWTSRTTSFVTGPATHVDRPTRLTRLRIHVHRRGDALSGQAFARYVAPGDDGQWRGSAALPGSNSAKWRAVRAESLDFRWLHYAADGHLDQFGAVSTIPEFTAAQGGDGKGAWVGFGFGCNGDKFDVDALQVAAGRESRTFDFGQYVANARLTTSHGGTGRTTIIAGARPTLEAALVDGRGRNLNGTVKLQHKDQGRKKYTVVDKFAAPRTGSAKVSVRPLHSGVYRLSYPGTSRRSPDASTPITVLVRSNVRAHFRSGSVPRGGSFTIAGKFYPGRPAKASLQRYARGTWTTVKTFGTARDGSYRVSAPTRRIGKSYWRIRVPQGGGNLDGHSPSLRLITNPRGSSGGTPSNPTPPPVDDPQPPPPPTGPQ